MADATPVKSENVEASGSTSGLDKDVEADKYHPSFNSPDADVILCSSDDTSFRIHRHTLTDASAWFATMFSVPQDAAPRSPAGAIRLDEPAAVLAGLLQLVTGRETALDDAAHLEAVLAAAEKYEMPGPVRVLRAALFSPLLGAAPLALYRIAAARGWEREAQWASGRTLALDLCAPESVAELKRLDGPSYAALMLLHRRRRDGVRAGLEDTDAFSAGNAGVPVCSACKKAVVPAEWNALKYRWVSRMEQSPFGEALTIPDLLEPEVVAARAAKCAGCGALLYVQSGTMENLHDLIARLPKSIEVASVTPV